MAKLTELYFRLLKLIIVLCLAAMVVMVFSNVVMRYVLNTGLPVSEELSRWCFVWLTFLGSIVVLRDRAHLGVDILTQALPPAMKKVFMLAANGLMLYATWLILLGSWDQTIVNMGSNAPASGFSLGWLFGVGVVFAVSTGVILIAQIYQTVITPAAEIHTLLPTHVSGAE